MAVSTSAAARKALPKTFQALCALHWPRPIHDKVDFDNAIKMVDRLAVRSPDSLTKGQADYLETLTVLIEAYEAEHAEIDTGNLDPIDLLQTLMEGRQMSASDLGRLLGNRELGSAILRRERQLSKANMMALAKHFSVSPALFLR